MSDKWKWQDNIFKRSDFCQEVEEVDFPTGDQWKQLFAAVIRTSCVVKVLLEVTMFV